MTKHDVLSLILSPLEDRMEYDTIKISRENFAMQCDAQQKEIQSLQSELTASGFTNNLLNTKIEIIEKLIKASKEENTKLINFLREIENCLDITSISKSSIIHKKLKNILDLILLRDELLADTSQKEKS